jgi:hypothetical protein
MENEVRHTLKVKKRQSTAITDKILDLLPTRSSVVKPSPPLAKVMPIACHRNKKLIG